MDKYRCNLCGEIFAPDSLLKARLDKHALFHSPNVSMNTKNRIKGDVKWEILQ